MKEKITDRYLYNASAKPWYSPALILGAVDVIVAKFGKIVFTHGSRLHLTRFVI